MYKKASRLGLRYTTTKGLLTTEQLWSLSFSELTNAVKEAKKLVKNTDFDEELSFLGETSKKDEENQLRFDILKDVFLTRKKEIEEKQNENEVRKYNQRIDELIIKKREEELSNKSIEELEAMRKQ